jgi:hypothetical protein
MMLGTVSLRLAQQLALRAVLTDWALIVVGGITRLSVPGPGTVSAAGRRRIIGGV